MARCVAAKHLLRLDQPKSVAAQSVAAQAMECSLPLAACILWPFWRRAGEDAPGCSMLAAILRLRVAKTLPEDQQDKIIVAILHRGVTFQGLCQTFK
jgi:hypothetical protein